MARTTAAKTITITVRNVPKATRDELAARAERNGQSLQEYLRDKLIQDTSKMELREWLARVRENKKRINREFTSEEIVRLIHEGRGE